MSVHVQQRCRGLKLASRQDIQAHGQKECPVVRKQHTFISTFSMEQYAACLSTIEFPKENITFSGFLAALKAPHSPNSSIHIFICLHGPLDKKGNA